VHACVCACVNGTPLAVCLVYVLYGCASLSLDPILILIPRGICAPIRYLFTMRLVCQADDNFDHLFFNLSTHTDVGQSNANLTAN